MSLRDKRQEEFANIWMEEQFGILFLCPRFGKCRVGIKIMQKLKAKSVLIAYPDKKIKQSWEEDLEKLEYHDSDITYTTHLSLWKYIGQKFDLVILDECHLLSEAQLDACRDVLSSNKTVLALTGSLAQETEKVLYNSLNLSVVAEYSIEKAIEEGIITDYQITVIKTPLDSTTLQTFGNKRKTEKQRFDDFTYLIDQAEKNHRDTKFLRIMRMRVVQNSIAKLRKTKEVLEKLKSERILVFCGTIASAESLGIPSFHSKSKDKNVFEDFVKGKEEKLAVVKIGNTGR